MKLKLTLVAAGQRDDVVLTTDATATIGEITEHIRLSHPRATIAPSANGLSLSVNPGTPTERLVTPDVVVTESGIRSGDVVALADSQGGARRAEAPVATLNVVSGPGSPATFPLQRGTNLVGRDRSADVRLSDPLVSKRHAKVNVSDMVQVIDDGSANGIVISGQVVDRAVLKPGGVATIGDTTFSVTLHTTQAAVNSPTSTSIEFNRSPRLDPQYAGVELTAPEPPQPPQPQRFPVATLVAPLLMAGVLFAVTKNVLSILFIGMSPILMIGAYLENRISGKRMFAAASDRFRTALADLTVQLEYAAGQEGHGRRREHPSAPEIEDAMRQLSPLAWTRRPEHDSFLQFRLGLGSQPSRNSVKMPSANNTAPELWTELSDVVSRFTMVAQVPIVADWRSTGNVGVAGPAAFADPLFNNLVGQMVGLHSPAELVVAAVASGGDRWDWLKWLPHVGSEFSPLNCDHLASSAPEANTLVSALEDLVALRSEGRQENQPFPLPAVLVLVDDQAPIERARLVQIAELGAWAGVFVAWYSPSLERLPASCRTFIEVDDLTGRGRAGFVQVGRAVEDLEAESISQPAVENLARLLSPLVDSGIRADDEAELPASVGFLDLAGDDTATEPEAIVDLWRQNNALPLLAGAPKPRRENTLRALVGQTAGGPLHLDLRSQGPHALVGGTTGSGKSEFLQSWVLGMAAMHSPSRVTFLFVDYKGGAAFAECTELPHCVGLVTDLSPHLVQRALTSLNAELRHREHILNVKKAKDLVALERANDPETPPSLVIVVDEFAALAKEVPEFVEGVIDVAQRGRSLGLHLVLATQRPAGVITNSLRANTNLRIALRMNDADDSTDVIGTTQAASFDPSLPGRAVARTGPGRLVAFQSAYVGGWTTNEPIPPKVDIGELRFGFGHDWDMEEPQAPSRSREEGPNDLVRTVSNINRAAERAEVPRPRRPWLSELARTYKLEDLPSSRTDHELVFGAADHPESQSQPVVSYRPNEHGNMAVYGTGGTGKSALLRSIAVASAFSPARGGACHVYGIDFGSRGLAALEPLPTVGAIIRGDDSERVTRVIRWLRDVVDERAERYAAINADTIDGYRSASGVADPRIILLVDGVGSFQQAYDFSSTGHLWDVFVGVASEGRSVGVHVVVSADRPASVSSALNSAIQQRLALRLANENDAAALDLPNGVLSSSSPPGRGVLDGHEVQVAVIGGEANASSQSAAIDRLASAMERAGIEAAPPIERLPEVIERAALPDSVDGLPCLGTWAETLGPIGFESAGTFAITGPARSGRSTALLSVSVALKRHDETAKLFAFTGRRTQLTGARLWERTCRADSPEAAEMIASIRDEMTERSDGEPPIVVVVESIEDLSMTQSEELARLAKELRKAGHMVIAEGDAEAMKSYNDFAIEIKTGGTGLVLQPDEYDGEAMFKTPFPKISRADFPPGRGMFVHRGRAYRVQVPIPV